MLDHRLRRWPEIKPTWGECIVLTGRAVDSGPRYSRGYSQQRIWSTKNRYNYRNRGDYAWATHFAVNLSSKHDTAIQCWVNVDSASETMVQHLTNIASVYMGGSSFSLTGGEGGCNLQRSIPVQGGQRASNAFPCNLRHFEHCLSLSVSLVHRSPQPPNLTKKGVWIFFEEVGVTPPPHAPPPPLRVHWVRIVLLRIQGRWDRGTMCVVPSARGSEHKVYLD